MECIHDVPIDKGCEKCNSGIQGRLVKPGFCHKCADLEEEVQVLWQCLNGSTKAKYTAELYDIQVIRAEKAEAEVDRLSALYESEEE
jgi:hypothetical protein